jgi:hypothetical protein
MDSTYSICTEFIHTEVRRSPQIEEEEEEEEVEGAEAFC